MSPPKKKAQFKGENMTEMIVIKKDGGIAEVLLNRLVVFNAFNLYMMKRLSGNLIALAVDNDIRG